MPLNTSNTPAQKAADKFLLAYYTHVLTFVREDGWTILTDDKCKNTRINLGDGVFEAIEEDGELVSGQDAGDLLRSSAGRFEMIDLDDLEKAIDFALAARGARRAPLL